MIFGDFDKTQTEMKQRGDAARMSADDGVKPESGKVYSVSPSFLTGDRSWVDCFWHVLELSGPNAFVRIEGRFDDVVRFEAIDDRAWYDATSAYQIAKEQTAFKS